MNNDFINSRLQRFFYVCFFCFVLAFAKADAQPSTPTKSESTFFNIPFKVVDIQLQEYLNLEVTMSTTCEVKLMTIHNGEYKDAIQLSSKISNDTLIISDPFSPTFMLPQDKLGVHKIIDAKAVLFLPENKKLVINSQSADLKISGYYKDIYVNQLSGSCKIINVRGDLKYVSVYADVFLDIQHYKTEGFSRTGHVTLPDKRALIKYFAQIESINGNISHIKKTNK